MKFQISTLLLKNQKESGYLQPPLLPSSVCRRDVLSRVLHSPSLPGPSHSDLPGPVSTLCGALLHFKAFL